MNKEYIKNIAQEGAKKPIYQPNRQLAIWSVVMVIYAIVVMLNLGLRVDFSQRIVEPLFILEMVLLVMTSFVSAMLASFLALPDVNQRHLVKKVPFIIFASLCLLIVVEHVMQGPVITEELCGGENYQCLLAMMIFAIIPSSIFFVILYRATTMHCALAGFMIGLCGGSFSYLLLRLIHSTENFMHLFAWHLLPIFLVTAICIIIAKLIAKVKEMME